MSYTQKNAGAPNFDTLADALLADMRLGTMCFVVNNAGTDGTGLIYRVSAAASGGVTMTNGLELVVFKDNQVDSVVDLPTAIGSGNKINVTSYYTGWAATGDGLPKGGGVFVDSAQLSVHNGVTLFDPLRSAEIGTAAYYTPAAAINCWVRLDVNPSFYGAGVRADGIVDDTVAFSKWANIVSNPNSASGSIRITSPVTITSPLTWIPESPDETYIIPDLGTTGGKILALETDDVHIENLGISALGLNYTLTANQYCIYAGNGSTQYKNHTYINNKIINITSSDGNAGLTNLLVSHGIYVDKVDNVVIKKNEINTTSGAGIFLRNIVGLVCTHNRLTNNRWYVIHINGGVFDFEIDYNRILCSDPDGVFWGGAIDMMNQHIPLQTRSARGTISHNYFEGIFSYGAVIRCFSCEDVILEGNRGRNLSSGLVAVTPDMTMIRVGTRGTVPGSHNGPVKNITVRSNIFQCPETAGDHRGVYCDNQYQTARAFASGVTVINNRMLKSDLGDAFAGGYLFHGNDGGMEEVICKENYAETEVNAAQPVLGGIGFIANSAQGKIIGVDVGGNIIMNQGTPAASSEIGLNIGAYVDKVMASSLNRLENFYYTLRTFTNAGPTLEYLNNLQADTVVITQTLYGVPLSRYAELGQIRTTTQLDDITDKINTDNKWEGKKVFNSTANKPVYATGGAAGSTWNDGAGVNTNNPV